MDALKKYGKLLLGFAISTAVVFGSMNMWLLTVISPVFVFLIFKALKIWKTKERGIYGVPAIVIGITLFFLAFSYHVASVPQGDFENENMKAVIEPYSTSNMSAIFDVTATYKGVTSQNLSYVVTDLDSNLVVKRSEVSGMVSGNLTVYHFQLNLPRGIYNITMKVNNKSLFISAVKEDPVSLFQRYMIGPGMYLAFLLSALYLLLIIGIHIMRKGQKMGRRYELKK